MSYQIINEGVPETNKAEYRADADGVYVVSCAGCGQLIQIPKPEYSKTWVKCPPKDEKGQGGCGRIDNCAFIPRSVEG
jgi:hypothetical protein